MKNLCENNDADVDDAHDDDAADDLVNRKNALVSAMHCRLVCINRANTAVTRTF